MAWGQGMAMGAGYGGRERLTVIRRLLLSSRVPQQPRNEMTKIVAPTPCKGRGENVAMVFGRGYHGIWAWLPWQLGVVTMVTVRLMRRLRFTKE